MLEVGLATTTPTVDITAVIIPMRAAVMPTVVVVEPISVLAELLMPIVFW
jgi:hypothetical protein